MRLKTFFFFFFPSLQKWTIFSYKKKTGKEKNCGRPTGFNLSHPLDRKQTYLYGQPQGLFESTDSLICTSGRGWRMFPEPLCVPIPFGITYFLPGDYLDSCLTSIKSMPTCWYIKTLPDPTRVRIHPTRVTITQRDTQRELVEYRSRWVPSRWGSR